MKKLGLATCIILFLAAPVFAKHIHVERYYQDIWCFEQGGNIEVRMKDGTRCDCLTEDMATEVDFAKKWYEGVTQALHYSMLTGRPGGLLLIVETKKDWKYVERARTLIKFYNLPIKIFTISP
jgi:hypothetical protein